MADDGNANADSVQVAPEAPPSPIETPVEVIQPSIEPNASTPEPTSASAQTSPPQAAIIPASSSFTRDFLAKASAVIQFRKQKKLAQIMTELEKKSKVTNDEVEKLLHVSDATATRYLSALEKQGKIKQIGKTGKAVEYQKI